MRGVPEGGEVVPRGGRGSVKRIPSCLRVKQRLDFSSLQFSIITPTIKLEAGKQVAMIFSHVPANNS